MTIFGDDMAVDTRNIMEQIEYKQKKVIKPRARSINIDID